MPVDADAGAKISGRDARHDARRGCIAQGNTTILALRMACALRACNQ
jgi:hypothetical protein